MSFRDLYLAAVRLGTATKSFKREQGKFLLGDKVAKNSGVLRGEEDKMTEDRTIKMTWTVVRGGQ